MLKMMSTLSQHAKFFLTLGQNAQVKTCFGLGLNFMVQGLTLGQNTSIFMSCFCFNGLGWNHIKPKDIWLTMFVRHLL